MAMMLTLRRPSPYEAIIGFALSGHQAVSAIPDVIISQIPFITDQLEIPRIAPWMQSSSYPNKAKPGFLIHLVARHLNPKPKKTVAIMVANIFQTYTVFIFSFNDILILKFKEIKEFSNSVF